MKVVSLYTLHSTTASFLIQGGHHSQNLLSIKHRKRKKKKQQRTLDVPNFVASNVAMAFSQWYAYNKNIVHNQNIWI